METKKTNELWGLINPIDVDALARDFQASGPLRHFAIDDFLRPAFFSTLSRSFPSYEAALPLGQSFSRVNETRKIQITEQGNFPPPVRMLDDLLNSSEFREVLSRVTGIEELLFDPDHNGGGIHIMDSGARLDVHLDFNILPERSMYRRLNLLVFTSPTWRPEWGGAFELWDPDVRERLFSAPPLPNRCVAFETSETSFHGVTPVRSPRHVTLNSFANYYYTEESPEALEGRFHSTVFRARPDEWWRRNVMMPAESFARRLAGLRGSLRVPSSNRGTVGEEERA